MKDDLARGLGFFVAGLGPLAVALLVVPFREQPASTAVVLVLLVSVIAAAAVLAGVAAAVTATLVAALSFNFLFTRPYLVVEVNSSDDVWPILVLLATGVGNAVIVGRRRPSRGVAPLNHQHQPNQSRHIERVVGLIDQGVDPRDLISAVQAELTALLVLRGCRFDADASATRLPRLERNGMVSGNPELPIEGVELLVEAPGRSLGRFVLHPTPGASVPLEHRIVAMILTDHLAAAIASHQPTAPH